MDAFWGFIVSNSLVVFVIAAGILILSRFWKHAATLHVLWILVLVKLFLPPLFVADWPIRLSELPTSNETAGIVENTVPIGTQPSADGPSGLFSTKKSSSTINRAASANSSAAGFWRVPIRWTILLGTVWIAGTVLLAARTAWQIWRFRKIIEKTHEPADDIVHLLQSVARRMGLARVPHVLMTSSRTTPLIWLFGYAPVLVLPQGLFGRLNHGARETILIHELAHVRRRDHWVRLLELTATTVFWWHPVVWLARTRIRELEEECCDQAVVKLTPLQARTYATALVDTLDFLSECTLRVAPLATAIYSTGSLARRIKLLQENRTQRVSILAGSMIAAALMVPLSIGFGQTNADDVPKITGRITDKGGKPVAGAVVRIAMPATEMRHVDEGMYEDKSDEDGRYEIKLEGLGLATTVSVDALAPGYQRLSGSPRMWAGKVERGVAPGKDAEASFTLQPGLYVKGIVVNEAGLPVPNVRVAANANIYGLINGTERVVSSGGVERTRGRDDGTFEVFNFLPEPLESHDVKEKGAIGFHHPDYVPYQVADVYALSEEERTNLRIVLPTGSKAAGIVLDADGKPVADVMVEVFSAKEPDRDKATMTNAEGKFRLEGLKEQDAIIRVHAMKLRQKVAMPVALGQDQENLEIRLEPVAISAEPKSVEVLGMKLADITPELRARYDLYHDKGALILGPGTDSARLGVGELREGYYFWMVGQNHIGSVHEFVEGLLKEVEKSELSQHGYRVVYTFSDVRMVGSNTQYMKLTEEDVSGLREVLKTLDDE
jgi:beta-lactamase regulating signal transducer with metallopeptidase domain